MLKQSLTKMVAEVRVSLFPHGSIEDRPQVINSKQAVMYFKATWENLNYHETFRVMFLNTAKMVIGIRDICIGGLEATVVDIRMIFQAALGVNATAMILAHNHPSGTLEPSVEDLELTRRIVEGGQFLDIPVVDHIILTEKRYYSFADDGLL